MANPRPFGTCFFEQYAQITLASILGSEFECLVNRDRPDLQTPDDKSIGIEVTRAMEESKKAEEELLKDIAGSGRRQVARSRMEGDPDQEEQPAGYGAEFTLMDFLDDYNRMHSPCKEFVFSYIDDDEPDGTEDYGVGLVDVTKNSDEYILKILSQVNECQDTYLDEDWRDWCERMARLYGCKVFLHKVSEVYETDIHEEETRLFESVGDSVKQTALHSFPYKEPAPEPDDEIPF